jgi:hypothetical protein
MISKSKSANFTLVARHNSDRNFDPTFGKGDLGTNNVPGGTDGLHHVSLNGVLQFRGLARNHVLTLQGGKNEIQKTDVRGSTNLECRRADCPGEQRMVCRWS